LKKLFFASSSVAKHSAEKTGDFIREESDELIEQTRSKIKESRASVEEKTSGLKDSIRENADRLMDKTKEKMDRIAEEPAVKRAAEISEDVGDRILTSGEKLVSKAEDISEDVGERILKGADKAMDKGRDISEDVGGKLKDVGEDIMDTARETADRLGDKLEETMKKADEWAEAERKKPKKDFADEDLDASGSLLDDKDDFFSKASKYADGDYDSFSEGKITIQPGDKPMKKDKDTEPASNFIDHDGDGNEIIDDAILDDSTDADAPDSSNEGTKNSSDDATDEKKS